MSGRNKLGLLLPCVIAILMVALVLLAVQVRVVQSQESDEGQRERELALEAERAGAAATGLLPTVAEDVIFPLFMGVDDAAIPSYTMDPTTNISTTAFVGAQVWGAAYDGQNHVVYFNSGSTLYEWPVGGAINMLGTIVDEGASTQAMVSLAFYDGRLHGTKNIANEAVWAIDTETQVATVAIDYVDADYDFGGLAFDPVTGELYGTNDDATPHGNGLFRINSNGTATLIAPYPAGQTDIDGLAISDEQVAYLITDEPGFVYVYDLVAGSYGAPLVNPWTTSEVFSGGAYIQGNRQVVCSAPSLAIPDNNASGVSDAVSFDGNFTLSDLNVRLNATHSYVGDLKFTLRHEDTGTEAVIVDRPGVPASTFGCSGNDVAATIDDEGADGNVEDTCLPAPPAIAGELVGGDPPNTSLLAAFDGENLAGTWTLTVSDNAGGDTGTLDDWCLVAEGGQPAIDVDPAAFHTFMAPDTEIVRQLTISNTGAVPLEWEALEEEPLAPPATPATTDSEPAVTTDESAPGPASLSELDAEARADRPTPERPHLTGDPGRLAELGLIYYGERPVFDAAFPALPLEDFEDGLWGDGAILGCPAPFDATTDNACFAPGGILPGISFRDNPLNDAGGGSTNGLAGIGAGPIGATSKNIVANTFVDSFEIVFDPPVHAAGMDLVHYTTNGATVDVELYDETDAMIAATTAWANNAGDFWGVYSVTPIARINILSPLPGADGAEGVDNVAFGTATVCSTLDDLPWLSVDPLTGTVPSGSSAQVDVTFDATGLAVGEYSGRLCISSNDPQAPLVRLPVTLTVAIPSIVLTKTVGLDPTVCASGDSLELTEGPGGVQVTYCYEVQNTGVITLNSHDLVDDQLGTILSGFPYTLAPGASAFVTQTTMLHGDTVNTATWTATSPAAEASDSDTATVTVNHKLFLPFTAKSPTPSAPLAPASQTGQQGAWFLPGMTVGLVVMLAAGRRRR